MEAIHEIVEADTLSKLFKLPPAFAHYRIEVIMRPVIEEPPRKIDISRFLSGAVDWSEATPEEQEEGYKAMAEDEEYEAEAREWINGMGRVIADD